jgi:hypothetical protein
MSASQTTADDAVAGFSQALGGPERVTARVRRSFAVRAVRNHGTCAAVKCGASD